MNWISGIATLASTIAAAFSAYFAWQAVKTSTDERRNQRDDACLIAVSSLQSAIHRCLSAVRDKRKQEIWPTHQDAWDHQTRFRSAYRLARRYHTALTPGAPDKIDQLFARLEAMGKWVEHDGLDPDKNELDKISTELKGIVDTVWEQAGVASSV
jgi:hypothetical protein